MTRTKEIPNPSALLTDVDRTLLNTKRLLSKNTLQAIKDYLILSADNPQMPKLALCTARHPAALINTVLPVFVEYAPESLHVVCDGAMLINSKAEIIWQEAIDSQLVKEICSSVEQLGASFAFASGDAFYCGGAFLKERREGDEDIKYLPYVSIKNQENWTTTLIIINHLNEAVEAYVKNLKDRFDFHIQKILSTFNHQYYYNVTLNNVSKASGLKKWAEYHQLDPEKIMMIGDGDNDIEAMETGIGVAVANAKPAVKEIADLVLQQSNDDDAIAWLLNEMIKKSPSPQ
jgi:Cof subfamily protein (haloacid dehalogenase superfamily)